MNHLLRGFLFLLLPILSQAAQFYIPNSDLQALKSAITASNTNNSTDTIHLYPYGIYSFKSVDHNFVLGNNALPRIKLDGNYSNALTILGNGATLTVDTALKNVRLLYLEDCSVKIYDTRFTHGNAVYTDDPGGAMLINGSSNTTQVNLYNCLFQHNTAHKGGAIYVSSAQVLIDNCTFTDNAALFMGGVLTNFSGIVTIKNSVLTRNICTNTSGPGALYNYTPLNGNSANNIYLQNSLVAMNTYQNTTQTNHGAEYDLAQATGIYTLGNNFIGSYDNTIIGSSPTPFVPGLPTPKNDYVGASNNVLDPKLGTLTRQNEYTETFSISPGSLALVNKAGNKYVNTPQIASYGLFPIVAIPGTELTIFGKNLSNIVKVQFQGATVTSGLTVTDSCIRLPVPTGARTGKLLLFDSHNNLALSDQEFQLGVVTGLEIETVQEELDLYPNPATNLLRVKSGSKRFAITNLMQETIMTSEEGIVDVSMLPRGIYFVTDGNSARRFVKE